MKSFDVQGIALDVPFSRAFAFLADPAQLPVWTHAFATVSHGRAVMRTPNGEISVDLEVQASRNEGAVDWRMKFPNGDVATAFSRLVPLAPDRCIYSFILIAPPVPLEQLEGALEAQSRTLAEELAKLKQALEHGA